MSEKVTIVYQVAVQQELDPKDYQEQGEVMPDWIKCAEDNAASVNEGMFGLDEVLAPTGAHAVEVKAVSVTAGWT